MSISNTNEIVINPVTYLLPTKGFLIDYAINESRELPVVKEFVLRLLYTLGNAVPSDISDFFGFTENEVHIVLEDLDNSNLLEWNEGAISLSEYAKERFEDEGGKMVPRFFKIEDAIDSVCFEINSFRIAPKLKDRNVFFPRLNVDIPVPPNAYANSIKMARDAFDKQFYEFREKIKKVDVFTDKATLYKINNVVSKYNSFVLFDMNLSIEYDNPKNIIFRYADDEMLEWDLEGELFASIDRTLLMEPNEQNLASSFNEYIKATRDPFLASFWVKDSIDLNLAINAFKRDSVNPGEKTRMLTGNLYSAFNQNILKDMLDSKVGRGNKIQANGGVWFVNPNNKIWGKTWLLNVFFNELNDRFDKRRKNSEIVLVMPDDNPAETRVYKRLYENLDSRLQLCGNCFAGVQSEVLLIPGVIVACLFHVPVKKNKKVTVPIGFISTDEEVVKKVAAVASEWSLRNKCLNGFFDESE